jgi:hypothetical protein
VAKDKYTDLPDQPGIRVRVERLDGNWSKRDAPRWWDRELVAFITPASPAVAEIVSAEARIVAAVRACEIELGQARAEVVMFHGTFVKIEIWCPAGTAARFGLKGYA